MAIRVLCPGCKGVLMCGDESRGKRMRCKKCQTIFAVPAGNKPEKAAAVATPAATPASLPAAPAEIAADDTISLLPSPTPPPRVAPAVAPSVNQTIDFDSPTDLDLEALQMFTERGREDIYQDAPTPHMDEDDVLSVLLEQSQPETQEEDEEPVVEEDVLDFVDEPAPAPTPPRPPLAKPIARPAVVEDEDVDEIVEEFVESDDELEEIADDDENIEERSKPKKKAAPHLRGEGDVDVPRSSFGQRFRYHFDTFMAKGGVSIFMALVILFSILFVLFTVVRGLVYLTFGSSMEDGDFWKELFVLFLQLTDPGAVGEDKDSSFIYKTVGILAAFSGVLVVSMLIAFITTALDQRLQQLKKGTSKVIEEGHTLILGWNERVVEILRELVVANESERNPCAVILSEHDKETMDDYLRMQLPERKNTRVVTRTGGVSALVNLDLVSITTCKSVIILASCSDAASPEEKAASDIRALKTLLGVMATKGEGKQLEIVLELFDSRNQQIAHDVSPTEVRTVNANNILAKILVQTSRSVGLSVVYSELMSFVGAEMYFHHEDWPESTFGQLQFHFPDGVPLGIRQGNGKIVLNPPADSTLAEDDDIIILAEDDSSIDFRKKPVVRPRDLPLRDARLSRSVEHELIIGWNAKAPTIITEYADYLLAGSSIDVLHRNVDDAMRAEIAELQKLENVRVTLFEQDPLKTETLDAIDPSHYDNILILSAGGANADPETTDSETIVILLLLRQIIERKKAAKRPKLISEVMDSRNQELIARAGVHDFIISNRLVSMLLAQISEQGDIQAVYDDLFSEEGSEIYLKPASLYFERVPIEVTFGDVMRIAQKRGEVCMGVKIKALERDATQNFGVKLIPEKTKKYVLQPDDALVVLAENET